MENKDKKAFTLETEERASHNKVARQRKVHGFLLSETDRTSFTSVLTTSLGFEYYINHRDPPSWSALLCATFILLFLQTLNLQTDVTYA